MQHQPYDYSQAKQAALNLAAKRRRDEEELRKAIEEKARTEAAYRQVLAQEIVKAKADHPATVAVDIAKGSPQGSEALTKRLIAEGMVDVWKERLKLHAEDRATLHRLIEWSLRVAPDGQLVDSR